MWRAGLDLNPVDLESAAQRRWLDALIWPGEEHLRTQLHRAIELARRYPIDVRQGDLRRDLASLAAEAPADATLVVFHTAVLAYVPDAADRERFAAELRGTRATWLANETPRRIPGLPDHVVEHHPVSQFLLTRDGHPLARTDPHGAAIHWLSLHQLCRA